MKNKILMDEYIPLGDIQLPFEFRNFYVKVLNHNNNLIVICMAYFFNNMLYIHPSKFYFSSVCPFKQKCETYMHLLLGSTQFYISHHHYLLVQFINYASAFLFKLCLSCLSIFLVPNKRPSGWRERGRVGLPRRRSLAESLVYPQTPITIAI